MILCRWLFSQKTPIFWSLSFFANLVCLYIRKITHYSVQPNNSANIWLKNPDIRIKQKIRLESWIRFLLKQVQKFNIQYLVDKKLNTFLNYSASVIRSEYQWQNIRIWILFLITPVWFTPKRRCADIRTFWPHLRSAQ